MTQRSLSLPAAPEAEEALLGSVLLEPETLYTLRIRPEEFYYKRNQMIFAAMLAAAEKNGMEFDRLAVQSELDARGELERVGGAERLLTLLANVPSAYNARGYESVVLETCVRRKLIQASQEIAGLAFNPEGKDIAAILRESDEKLRAIEVPGNNSGQMLKEALETFSDALLVRFNEPQDVSGIPTGFDIDRYTGGLKKDQVIVVAGDPGMGKTAFAMAVGTNVAALNLPVCIFTLEMSTQQLVARMVAEKSGVNSMLLDNGKVPGESRGQVWESMDVLRRYPIRLYEEAVGTRDIRSIVARISHEWMVPELIIVDYSELLTDPADMEALRIRHIFREMKQLSKEFHTSVLVVHTKTTEQKDSAPGLTQLGWGRGAAYAGDVVIFLLVEKDELTGKVISAGAQIAKNRNGPAPRAVPLYFDPTLTRWRNLANEERSL